MSIPLISGLMQKIIIIKRLLNFTDVIKYVQVFGKYVCGPIQLGTKKPWVILAKTGSLARLSL